MAASGKRSGDQERHAATERDLLLIRLNFARNFADRRYADKILVQATRWLRDNEDPTVRLARVLLRNDFPVVH